MKNGISTPSKLQLALPRRVMSPNAVKWHGFLRPQVIWRELLRRWRAWISTQDPLGHPPTLLVERPACDIAFRRQGPPFGCRQASHQLHVESATSPSSPLLWISHSEIRPLLCGFANESLLANDGQLCHRIRPPIRSIPIHKPGPSVPRRRAQLIHWMRIMRTFHLCLAKSQFLSRNKHCWAVELTTKLSTQSSSNHSPTQRCRISEKPWQR